MPSEIKYIYGKKACACQIATVTIYYRRTSTTTFSISVIAIQATA